MDLFVSAIDCIKDILVRIKLNSDNGIDTEVNLLLNDLSKYDKSIILNCLKFLSKFNYIEMSKNYITSQPQYIKSLTEKGKKFLNAILID